MSQTARQTPVNAPQTHETGDQDIDDLAALERHLKRIHDTAPEWRRWHDVAREAARLAGEGER